MLYTYFVKESRESHTLKENMKSFIETLCRWMIRILRAMPARVVGEFDNEILFLNGLQRTVYVWTNVCQPEQKQFVFVPIILLNEKHIFFHKYLFKMKDFKD